MTKVATLTGHTYRVLYLAISPDGQTVVTGAGDETLRAVALGNGNFLEVPNHIWLVVWLPFCIFPYIGKNHPN